MPTSRPDTKPGQICLLPLAWTATKRQCEPLRSTHVGIVAVAASQVYFIESNLAWMASMTEPRSFLTGVGWLA